MVASPCLQDAIKDYSVVVLTGARQVGKSPLLLNAEPFMDWRFYTMDDFDVLRQANQDPEAMWAGADRVVLDEMQKAPDLLPAFKASHTTRLVKAPKGFWNDPGLAAFLSGYFDADSLINPLSFLKRH